MYRLISVAALLTLKLFAYADNSPAVPMVSMALPSDHLVQRVAAFGSCAKGELDQAIFSVVRAGQPDVFMFIGDNVYAEDESPDPELTSLKAAYGSLAKSRPFRELRESVPLMTTWDDHDYGFNDGGGDWSDKAASLNLYRHVWDIKAPDPRHGREGVYYAQTSGPVGKRVQFILLDTRYFRTPLQANPDPSGGRYLPSADNNQSMLGEVQWQWLERKLNEPAEVRIVATSIQMIADGHDWEAWRLLPKERQRFYKLLNQTGAEGVVLISGDRHSAAIYRQTAGVPYPLWEVTASSLNLPLTDIVENIVDEPGPFRVGVPFYEANFGVIDIDWSRQQLLLQVRDEFDRVVLAASVDMDELSPKRD